MCTQCILTWTCIVCHALGDINVHWVHTFECIYVHWVTFSRMYIVYVHYSALTCIVVFFPFWGFVDVGYFPCLLDNVHFTHVTQETCLSPKRHTCHPRGVYLLDIPLGYASWMACMPLELHHTVCYPRGVHAPKRHGLPEIQFKRHAQEVHPRRTYLLGYMHASWAHLLGCIHISWVACLLGCRWFYRCSLADLNKTLKNWSLTCNIFNLIHPSI